VTLLEEPPRVAVITISDGVAAGTRQDLSGPAIRDWALAHGFTVVSEQVVPDERERIADALTEVADAGEADVVITTGGTGLTARDVTPEATRAVITRDVPGLGERIRAAGLAHTPYAALSRGVTGVRAAARRQPAGQHGRRARRTRCAR
jgi:molybdopterin adenylyltransferase